MLLFFVLKKLPQNLELNSELRYEITAWGRRDEVIKKSKITGIETTEICRLCLMEKTLVFHTKKQKNTRTT